MAFSYAPRWRRNLADYWRERIIASEERGAQHYETVSVKKERRVKKQGTAVLALWHQQQKGVKVVVRGLEFMRAMEEAMKLKCRQKIALDK